MCWRNKRFIDNFKKYLNRETNPYHNTVDPYCYVWTGRVSKRRGKFDYGNKVYDAQESSWSLHNHQEFPENAYLLSDCYNILCCNPHHLFLRLEKGS